jgi:hypothetical protein
MTFIKKEPLPKGLDACHSCDNRRCVNPGHLFAGTRKTNMQDCKTKGRTLSGERSYFAKLNWEQVREIRILLRAGHKKKFIAAVYSVSDTTIYRIARAQGAGSWAK